MVMIFYHQITGHQKERMQNTKVIQCNEIVNKLSSGKILKLHLTTKLDNSPAFDGYRFLGKTIYSYDPAVH